MIILKPSNLPVLFMLICPFAAHSETLVRLTEVPDYRWYYGCFGTASGNLAGYWDRHGFPNLYTGPTAGGVAPLDTNSSQSHDGIIAMWASQAGLDGRPLDQPGHVDDYYVAYESTAQDPYITAGRPEHEPDCIGDFIGLSQNKWTDMNGECDGNIDGYSFVYWDYSGERRINFSPSDDMGNPVPDIQSGLREWTRYRGYRADVFTQLTDFNPNVPEGQGFTFEDLEAEIDAGYPVLLFMQSFDQKSRDFFGMPHANPGIHGMLAMGYWKTDDGHQRVLFHTSWGSGLQNTEWNDQIWTPLGLDLPMRGVIGYHPLPQITDIVQEGGGVSIHWDGPASILHDDISGETKALNWYVVEKATSLETRDFEPATPPTTEHQLTIENCCDTDAFFRVRLLAPGEVEGAAQ